MPLPCRQGGEPAGRPGRERAAPGGRPGGRSSAHAASNVAGPIAPADVIAPTEAVWRAMLAGSDYPDGRCGRHAVQALVAANVSGERGGVPVGLTFQESAERVFPWA